MIFGLFKKKELPILRAEMLEPVNAPISTVDAKRVFKKWMVHIGYLSNSNKLDRDELAEHVEYLMDEIKGYEQALKDDLADAKLQSKEELKELKAELNNLKVDLENCTDAVMQTNIKQEITQIEKSIEMLPLEWSPEADALEKFKNDKRAFLVDYINNQVHGSNWKQKL